MADDKEHVLWSQSGVNKAGEPFIQLLQDDQPICQFTPEQARSHARDLLECTEAAEQDAFMVSFMREKVGLDQKGAIAMLVDFRKWREERGKNGPPSDPREFFRTDKHEKPAK
jgi:hypothetical protein